MPGIALALLTYALLVSLGLAKVINKFPNLYQAIHLSGACYLIYMGLTGLYKLSKTKFKPNPCAHTFEAPEKKCRLKLFTSGYLCALTNPKILIIYLTLLPQFVDHTLKAFPQLICLGLTHVLIVMASMTTYCILANKSQVFIKKYSKIQISLTNSILIALGSFLLFDKK